MLSGHGGEALRFLPDGMPVDEARTCSDPARGERDKGRLRVTDLILPKELETGPLGTETPVSFLLLTAHRFLGPM